MSLDIALSCRTKMICVHSTFVALDLTILNTLGKTEGKNKEGTK